MCDCKGRAICEQVTWAWAGRQEGDDSIDCRGGARAGARAVAPGVSRSDVNPTVRALVSWISWGLLPF